MDLQCLSDDRAYCDDNDDTEGDDCYVEPNFAHHETGPQFHPDHEFQVSHQMHGSMVTCRSKQQEALSHSALSLAEDPWAELDPHQPDAEPARKFKKGNSNSKSRQSVPLGALGLLG